MKTLASLLPLGALLSLSALVTTAAPPYAEAAKARASQGNGRGRDRTAPTIVCPGDFAVEATGAGGANVWFQATATDNGDPSPTITYTVPPGSLFSLGTTTVTATATDWKQNSSTCTFDVMVQDTTAPSVTCPSDVLLDASEPAGAVATFTAGAWDAVDPSPTVTYSHDPGSMFPVGTTTVTVTATDDLGNGGSCTFDVTVFPFDDDPTNGPFSGSYKWGWVDEWTPAYDWDGNLISEPVAWYEWSITVAPDGTISGAGWQYYEWWNGWESWGDPNYGGDDVRGGWYLYSYLYAVVPTETGELTGHVSDSGLCSADGTYYWSGYDDGSGEFTVSDTVSIAGLASLDADGNLLITDASGNVTVWQRR